MDAFKSNLEDLFLHFKALQIHCPPFLPFSLGRGRRGHVDSDRWPAWRLMKSRERSQFESLFFYSSIMYIIGHLMEMLRIVIAFFYPFNLDFLPLMNLFL